ncbi:BQ5605_C020g09064 [Microbotryum silenes-dioicae]|uniref:BQ5605_C020g09064 protein n=1 Tax=Microbotryum silenes-dioicae TaxID=796604 RepID=A0A2X0PKA7_9BASI|nr:BQ5605_C020g09064 [Microbotryum silenes-dioicae]
MCVGSWAGVADDDAALYLLSCCTFRSHHRLQLCIHNWNIYSIVGLSYSAQPSKVVPAKRRATGTRETIYLDDDDEV